MDSMLEQIINKHWTQVPWITMVLLKEMTPRAQNLLVLIPTKSLPKQWSNSSYSSNWERIYSWKLWLSPGPESSTVLQSSISSVLCRMQFQTSLGLWRDWSIKGCLRKATAKGCKGRHLHNCSLHSWVGMALNNSQKKKTFHSDFFYTRQHMWIILLENIKHLNFWI